MIALALTFVLGAWVLQQLPALPHPALALLLLPLASVTYLSRDFHARPRWALHRLSFILLAFAAGFFWAATYAQVRLADHLPVEWERRDIEVIGVIAGLPQQSERGLRFEFDVERVLTPGAVVPSHISLSHYVNSYAGEADGPISGHALYRAGQRWQLTVRLKRPHGSLNPYGFDFEAWALERDIRASGYVRERGDRHLLQELVYGPSYLVERLREGVRDHMDAVLAERPYAGVLRALAIGDESGIRQADWQTFLRTGTNHLMSISGLHITMLAGLAYALTHVLWRRSAVLTLALPARKAATLAGVLVALSYALMAGFSIPTQRTLYMLAVFALALWLGRNISIARVLAYALLVVVLLDPWAVLAVGFWLSFGAVAVIAYALGGRLRSPHWLREAVTTQWAVTLGLMPLLLFMFQQVSIISPLANALAIPLISLVVVPLTLFGSIVPLDWILLLAHQVMHWCMLALEWLAGSTLSVWQQQAPPFWTLLLAIAGVLWVLLPRGLPLRWVGLVAVLPMFLIQAPRPAYGAMRAAVLDVGQGLAVVVSTRHHALLYDAGPRYSSQSDSGSRIIVPYLRAAGIAHLDAMLVSHDDTDHSGGAESVLSQLTVDRLLTSLPPSQPLTAHPSHVSCRTGQSWQWDGVRFDVIFPRSELQAKVKDNDRSCVLRITSQHGRLLIPGDIERGVELELLDSEYALQSDVLIAPHHGSKTSSSRSFVEAVNPGAVVFTAGYLNRFRHPHPEVLRRYEDIGSHLYRSDLDGAVLIDFGPGHGMTFTRWRQHARRYWHQKFVAEGVSER